MRLALVPRTSEFYDLFSRAAEGDELTRELIELLNTQYITPFDREDIYELATALDDVVDHIENASDLLGLYKVQKTREEAVEQSNCSGGARTTIKRWNRAKLVTTRETVKCYEPHLDPARGCTPKRKRNTP